jgi:hypothetical protein
MSYLAWIWVPFGLLFLLMILNSISGRDLLAYFDRDLFGLRLLSINGTENFNGFAGLGIVSVGGLAIGFLAFGGMAIGVVAFEGGAVGLIAVGGGAVGLVAIGGGAAGYVAIGGGACGVYVLAGDGKGRYVLSRKRQDKAAVDLFCRYLPRLKDALGESP